MTFLDIFTPQDEPKPEYKSERYTFPATAFKEKGLPLVTVTMAKRVGSLAVVEDPSHKGLWQVVHIPTGLFLAQGTKPNMKKAVDRLAAIPGDWATLHTDHAEYLKVRDKAFKIKQEYDALLSAKGKRGKRNPPNFVYVKTKDDTIPVEIDGYKDRDYLILLSKRENPHQEIFNWLVANGLEPEDVSSLDQIEGIDLEMHDNEDDALSGGNETVSIW